MDVFPLAFSSFHSNITVIFPAILLYSFNLYLTYIPINVAATIMLIFQLIINVSIGKFGSIYKLLY